MVTIDLVKQLREETGVSITECKKALEETGGDLERAKEVLRKWGQSLAGKKSSRETAQGIVETYIHPNKKIGAMIELRCESDFVAKSDDFKKLAHELCLQITAMGPLYITSEDIPENFLDGEKKIYQEQFKNSGKPQKIVDQIIEGKLNKYKEEISLMEQLWIKDSAKTVKELINGYIARIGENMIVKKFVRYDI